MADEDFLEAARRVERLIDPDEHDVPPLADMDPTVAAWFRNPTEGLTDPVAVHAVEARVMPAVRALIESYRRELMSLLAMHQPGYPPVHGAVTRGLNLVQQAEREVVRAERGCGADEGECLDPCHVGVPSVEA